MQMSKLLICNPEVSPNQKLISGAKPEVQLLLRVDDFRVGRDTPPVHLQI